MQTNSPISDYLVEQPEEVGEIKKAQPKISDYRERFKRKELTLEDIRPPLKRPLVKDIPTAEDAVLLGPGVEEDLL